MPQAIDYLIIGFVVIGFVLGYKSGFISKLLSLAGLIMAVLGAFIFSPRLRSFLISNLDLSPSAAVILSFLIVFLIIILLSKYVIKLILPQKSVFSFIDRILGALVGTFQMSLFVSGLLILLSLFNIPDNETKSEMKYYDFTYSLLPKTFGFVRKIVPDSEIVFKLFEELKGKIEEGNGRVIQ